MKTAIIQLEPYDNIFSIRDRMEWSHAARILFIWPKRAKLIDSEIDLQILQRQAAKQGAQIALITRDAKVIENAELLNISVFTSVPQAESTRWKTNRKHFSKIVDSDFIHSLQEKEFAKTKPGSKNNITALSRGAAIVLSSLAIISLLLYLIPSASITLYPITTQKQITLSIWASPQVHEINVNGNLPAVQKQVEVSAQLQGLSSGTANIPSEFAKGEVTFTNLTNQSIVVPKGTVISTINDPVIRFSTLLEAFVPAGKNPIVSIDVQAEQAGSTGNLESGTLVVIEGSLGESLTVTNNSPTSGGTDLQAPSPTEQDYAKINDQLKAQLRKQAISEIAVSDERLITESLDSGKVVSEVRSLEPGLPGEQFNLSLTVRFTGLVYSENDLELLAGKAMSAGLISSNESNYSGEVQLKATDTSVEISSDGTKWKETAIADVGPIIDANYLASLVSGKKISEASQLLQAKVPSKSTPIINVYPFGWMRLPWASYQIQIQAK
jgi:hypothetical protein